MEKLKNIYKKIKKIRIIDVRDLIYIILLLPIAVLAKKVSKPIWIITERKDEARDNGYWFFKYMRENHKAKKVYYIINKKCVDYKKIEEFKNVIEYGSIKHYFYYIIATLDISAHVGSTPPNNRICRMLEEVGILKNRKIFLQHGIIKDKIDFVRFSSTKASIITCSSELEKEFLIEELGYPKNNVKLLGLCRFDGLERSDITKKILLMPTWRRNLKYNHKKTKEENFAIFLQSEYFKKYNDLLSNKLLEKVLSQENIELIFYPHFEIQPYIDLFNIKSNHIKIINKNDGDVQSLLKEASLVISDYSSIFFDVAYMYKPTILYQFDYEEFRKVNYSEGYFSYRTDAFGPVVSKEEEVIFHIQKYINDGFVIEKEYEEKVNRFFVYTDKDNCKRTYKAISNL